MSRSKNAHRINDGRGKQPATMHSTVKHSKAKSRAPTQSTRKQAKQRLATRDNPLQSKPSQSIEHQAKLKERKLKHRIGNEGDLPAKGSAQSSESSTHSSALKCGDVHIVCNHILHTFYTGVHAYTRNFKSTHINAYGVYTCVHVPNKSNASGNHTNTT